MESDIIHLVTHSLQRSDFYPRFAKETKEHILSSGMSVDCLGKSLKLRDYKHLLNEKLETQLRNEVYHLVCKNPKFLQPNLKLAYLKEPLDYLQKAQETWEYRLSKPLNSICTELGIPFARRRNVSEEKEFEERWVEFGFNEIDVSLFRPVYAPKDFLEVLCRVRNPNFGGGTQVRRNPKPWIWGNFQVPLLVQIDHLLCQFPEFAKPTAHLGVDANIVINSPFSFQEEKTILGKRVLAKRFGPLAKEFAKTGCPHSLRGDAWCQILGISITDQERLYYEHLKIGVFQKDVMLDRVIFKDVKLTSSNDDQYFVFEEYLYQVMLLFSRDTHILEHFDWTSATPLKVLARGRCESELTEEIYPPNGVIPFHGFTMLAAPLCYLYDDPVKLYFVFREFYTRYFFRLHSVTSHPQGILFLGLLFERLLFTWEPELIRHCQGKSIELLRVVIKWLMRAFSGFLPADQVLLLWDSILAYDSLQILAVLSAGIICLRATALRRVQSHAEAEVALSDLSTIKVIPVLMHTLSTRCHL